MTIHNTVLYTDSGTFQETQFEAAHPFVHSHGYTRMGEQVTLEAVHDAQLSHQKLHAREYKYAVQDPGPPGFTLVPWTPITYESGGSVTLSRNINYYLKTLVDGVESSTLIATDVFRLSYSMINEQSVIGNDDDGDPDPTAVQDSPSYFVQFTGFTDIHFERTRVLIHVADVKNNFFVFSVHHYGENEEAEAIEFAEYIQTDCIRNSGGHNGPGSIETGFADDNDNIELPFQTRYYGCYRGIVFELLVRDDGSAEPRQEETQMLTWFNAQKLINKLVHIVTPDDMLSFFMDNNLGQGYRPGVTTWEPEYGEDGIPNSPPFYLAGINLLQKSRLEGGGRSFPDGSVTTNHISAKSVLDEEFILNEEYFAGQTKDYFFASFRLNYLHEKTDGEPDDTEDRRHVVVLSFEGDELVSHDPVQIFGIENALQLKYDPVGFSKMRKVL